MYFKDFAFKPYIQKALQEIGFIKLTEIQKEIIPQALEGKSVIGKSLTGTGKTHAFLLPILQNLEEDKRFCQSIFLSPTRELAFQLYEETLKITKHSDIHIDVRLYTGGTDREDDIKRLLSSQPQIVIGTLGRIKDLCVDENVLKLHTAKTIVIDEADMFFAESELIEIDQVFSVLSNEIQIMVFSATISQNLIVFLNKYLQKIDVIDVTNRKLTKDTITHIFIPTKNKDKNELLNRLLKSFNPFLALIFANTKAKVDEISLYLASQGYEVAKLSGDLPPRQRKQILKRIKNFQYQYVVATDLAARGIDIPGTSHVINYELPEDIEFYIHRTGRAARFEDIGHAISFYDYEDDHYLEKLESKGINSIYMNLVDNQLVPTTERNSQAQRKRPTSTVEEELHRKIPLPKKVKPGYRKKRKELIEKQLRKFKRARIEEIYRRKGRNK
ncbi:MAG: DEAD/DEAH box helicase [Acholeplasmataceae bacterium]|nr:DEAD/DEAH box helicase [Acholeplasmataceae bacterium]